MPFPQAQRVIYNKNPLDSVICQLRFSPILKIEGDIPAEFQDRIRGDFPNFSETMQFKHVYTQGEKDAPPPDIVKQLLQSSSGTKNYEFSSEDGHWKINLTRNFLALTSHDYIRWEEFKERLKTPLNALIDIYAPNVFTRIGLRYVNVIRRSILGLDNVGWNELIKPSVLGIMGSTELSNHVKNFESRYEIGLSDEESIVKIITKFVQAEDDKEICYMIDSDFYDLKKIGIDAAIEKLDFFNVRASRLIHWCITEQLHQAMEPQEL